jgi:crossover junction endodeoxyribonuclease RusA
VSVTLRLPVPPSANRFYRVYRGRAVMSAEGRTYKQMVAQLAVAKRLHPATGPVSLDVVWYRAAKRGDLDNRMKVALDALEGVLFVNDAQIVELRIRRCEDKADPRMLVTVGPVAAAPCGGAGACGCRAGEPGGPPAAERTTEGPGGRGTSCSGPCGAPEGRGEAMTR